MPHDIKPATEHTVVTVQLAIHSTNPDEIHDGLNELLRPEIGEGWIADYALFQTPQATVVVAPDEPQEGEIFNDARTFILCVEESDGTVDWVTLHTTVDLAKMSESQLRRAVEEKVVIGQDARVYLANLNEVQPLSLTPDDLLRPYQVSVYEDKGDKHALDFFCLAEDDDHAAEQAVDAYPNGEVRHTTEIPKEDYPYDIH